jgi:putative toxin-antitoxin system antitoxin component (TIGR02293 family)
MQFSQTMKILGGKSVVGRIKSPAELDMMIQASELPTSSLDHFATFWSLEPTYRYKIVPRATLSRRKTLSPRHAELVSRLASISAQIIAFFGGDKEVARRFLTTPHPELAGKSPFERSLTEIGAREVEELIARIEHGLPA